MGDDGLAAAFESVPMISFHYEPTMIVSGCELTAVARVSVTKQAHNGLWLFSGDKRLVALICRSEDGEHIFDTDGRQIDAVELKDLMSDQGGKARSHKRTRL